MSIPIKQILIDFDGTITYHEFPFIGAPAPDAIRVITRLQDAGHILILHTMRCDEQMNEAKEWLSDRGLKFTYFNHNPMFETGSRKVYGHYHIDDHNVGCPLIHDHFIHPKPVVDWNAIEKFFEEKKLI